MNSCDPAGRDSYGTASGTARDGRLPFMGYCLLTGMLAVAAGAGASLFGGDTTVRLVVWAVVLALVTGAAGWWWAVAPATARRWTVDLLVRPAGRAAPTRTPSRKS
ncbi:hypothetical protein GCM10010145_54640 [Streptomyces ruber]|uniref:Uncharacterized protein n=2 Tax=Streptomyces TaxID=1883 RepID=A0A918BLK1_9ACTN|nr:hypothetical protein GCM10010145_54640 [Streptomyces ruber]